MIEHLVRCRSFIDIIPQLEAPRVNKRHSTMAEKIRTIGSRNDASFAASSGSSRYLSVNTSLRPQYRSLAILRSWPDKT